MKLLSSKPRKLRLNEIVGLGEAKQRIVATPRSFNSQEKLVEFVLGEFRKRTSDEGLSWDVKFISREMIDNARYHGNNLDSSKKIEINVAWKRNDFYFVVKDEGTGFDMKRPVIRAGPPEGGVGIFYAKRKALLYNFRDSASYVCVRVPEDKLEVKVK